MWNLKNKQTNKKQKQMHRYREQIDGYQMEGGLEGWVKKGEGIKEYKLVVTKQSWECEVQHREYSQ